MTTLQLPEEEVTRPAPGSEGGGQRRLQWLRDGWADSAERAGRQWAALLWGLTLTALLVQDPGRMTFDTKLGVDIDPVGFYERLWHLWNPLEWLGSLQDQYIGYAFPMGLFYLTAHALHVPVWVAERLWMSLLVTVAFLGVVRLAEALRIGSRPTRLLAGAAFALWPTFTILIGSTSAAVLPGVLAPWAVLPLIHVRSARRAAAVSALLVACMGGVNATSTLAALVLPGIYVLTRTGRRRWELAAWWAPAVLLATLWWLVPLLYQGKYGFNFLPYIEQSANTTQTMSASALLRGSGNWVAYLNFGVPWLNAASVVVGTVWAVGAVTVAAAAGLSGLARRDLPEALWLRGTIAVAALWGLTGYSGPLGGPLHGPVQELLNGSLSALRNVFKIEPVIAAVLALGIAHALARTVWRWRAARVIGTMAGVAALAGLALPFLNGQALQPGSFTQIPAYWQQAAAWLGTHNRTETTMVVPADAHGIYTWGQPIDEPLEPLASSPWVQANLVPYTGGGASDLVSGAEDAIESGTASPGLAAYLARAGIRYVLVRNDLDPSQIGYTPPTLVHAALQASGFTRVAAFGQPVPAVPAGVGTALQVQAIAPSYPPVEIFQAANPAERASAPAAVLPAASTTLVDGGPASLLQLEAQGLLGSRPAVIAGQDGPADPPATSQGVTDGLRRADTAFSLPNNNTSYTYTATETNPPDDPLGAGGQPPRQLLPAGTAGHQTVAVLTGAASVTASSAGSWLWEEPQADPLNAFDGDPDSAWTEATSDADGQWIQINFDRPLNLSGPVTIRLLDDVPRPVATRLVVTTATGQAVTDTQTTAAAQPLDIPSGSTRWLRITIAATRGGTRGGPGAGISEVTIPGVHVSSYLKPSQVQGGATPSFSFYRNTATTLGLPGIPTDPDLNRVFTTASAQRYTVSASAVAVPGPTLNTLLDDVGAAKPAQLTISASSTFGSVPALRPQNLLSTSSPAGWIAASPDATLHLQWPGQRTISTIQLTPYSVGIAAQPTQVLISTPSGTRDLPVPQSGVLTFPPLRTDQLDISFPSVMQVTAYNPLVGRAQQLPVGLAGLSIPALAGLNTGLPTAATPFALGCGQGPPLTIGGQTFATAVSGTVGELTSLTPLPLRVCGPRNTVVLRAGTHYLTSPGSGLPLTVTDLSLATAQATARASATAARTLHIGSWGTEYRTAAIGPGAQSYFEVHQAANPGWTATLNGHRLAPVTLDGWQQAFVVPAGAGGKVVLAFTPATGYRQALVVSIAAVALVIVAAAWPSWRRRRRRPSPAVAGPAASSGPGTRLGLIGYWLAIAGVTAVLAACGGLAALAVPVVLLVGWWSPRWVPLLAFAAMCAAGAVTISGLSHGAQYGFGAFSWPAQAAALVALAAALTPLRRTPGTVFTPERLASPELLASPEFLAIPEHPAGRETKRLASPERLAIPEHPAGRETTSREEAGPEGEGSR